jgi:hypothetical protein
MIDGVFDHHEEEIFDLRAIDASIFPEKETYILKRFAFN